MRRAAAAVAATVAGLIALLSYKSGPAPRTTVATGPSDSTAPTAPPTTPGPATPGSATPGSATPGPTTPGSTTPGSSTPATGARTITGPDVPNQYGDVQVQVTLQGSRITNVQALQLPQDRQRSAEISQAAGPLLREEVLQAQSANIDVISGATYTSDSYAQSVQAALDQARA